MNVLPPGDVNRSTDPFDLEPEDTPRRPPTTVTIGDGSDQRRWRHGGLVALGLLAALGAMTVATRDGRSFEGAVPATSSTPTSRPRPSTTTTAPTTSTTTGPMLGSPTGLTLVLQGESGVDVLDVDTGVVREIFGGPPNGPGIVPTREPAGVVVTSGATARFHPAPFDGPPTPLGPAEWVLASVEPGRVWLVRPTDGRTSAVEVTLDGTPTGPTVEIPGNTYPVAAVAGGLLVEAFGRLYVVDGDDVRPVASGALIAAGGRRIATQSCDDDLDCGIHLLDLVTGEDTLLEIPGLDGHQGYPSGFLSPDGTTLALWLYSGNGARLVLVDVATSRVEELVAPEAQNRGGGQMSWSPSGEWLFWTDGSLRAYHRDGSGYMTLRLVGAGGYWSVLAL